MPNFQEQVAIDNSDVFLNAAAFEFVTTHEIAGVRGDKASPPKKCQVIVDKDLYVERRIKDQAENVTLDGLVFFVKESHWLENFRRFPKIRDGLLFDGIRYQIVDLNREMGLMEVTLEANKGA